MRLRKPLVLVHRYLGIPLGVLFVIWFASGIVMMYAGEMPRLTPQVRLERLPPLDLSRVRLTPAEAARAANASRSPDRAALFTVMDRPAYRFGGTTVFADNGELLGDIGVAGSRAVAGRFTGLPDTQIHFAGTLTQPDQWTLTNNRSMPLHKFHIDDGAATQLYVSPRTAEVAVVTTRRRRALAWIGAIPHWFYFTALRVNQPLWSRAVVWASTLGCVLAVLGLLLGITQARVRYTGLMKWHYVTGVVFGVFTLSWVFSGLLSMEPYAWTNARGLELRDDAFTGGPLDLTRFGTMDPAVWDRITGGHAIREVEFRRIQNAPYYVVRIAGVPADPTKVERQHQPYYVTGRAERDRLLVAAETMTVHDEAFSVESLMTRLTASAPGVPVVESVLLDEYDSYYYSRSGQTPLPVLRVKLGDPGQTWFYIDPEMSRVLTRVHRFNRVERWLFNGLHSLDFPFWYTKRPLWDIGVITLSLGGLASSGIGLWLGVRRIRRALARMLPASRSPQHVRRA